MRTCLVLSFSALLVLLAGCRPVAEARQRAKLTEDLNTVRQVHLSLMEYSMDHDGKFPPKLQTLVDELGMDATLLKVGDGDGNEVAMQYVAGLTGDEPGQTVILFGPARSDGKRVAGYLDGSVKILPEADFQAQGLGPAEE